MREHNSRYWQMLLTQVPCPGAQLPQKPPQQAVPRPPQPGVVNCWQTPFTQVEPLSQSPSVRHGQ
jgi:hypothetical protein